MPDSQPRWRFGHLRDVLHYTAVKSFSDLRRRVKIRKLSVRRRSCTHHFRTRERALVDHRPLVGEYNSSFGIKHQSESADAVSCFCDGRAIRVHLCAGSELLWTRTQESSHLDPLLLGASKTPDRLSHCGHKVRLPIENAVEEKYRHRFFVRSSALERAHANLERAPVSSEKKIVRVPAGYWLP